MSDDLASFHSVVMLLCAGEPAYAWREEIYLSHHNPTHSLLECHSSAIQQSDGRGPTLAGVIAAASVLLAGSVYRSMRHNAEAAEERLLQQVQLQMKAESLAAQRAVSDAQVH